jgi:HEPN domain-containing protein
MNKLKDIDYSYFCFLQEALIDLDGAEILSAKELYSKSVMLFKQSVEMSCKYLGLLWKIICPSDGKKNIGYIPNKIFKDFFSTDVLKQIKGNFFFNQFEDELNSCSSIDGKIGYLINEMKIALNLEVVKRKENQTAIDAMIAFYRATGFKGISNIEFLENNKGNKEVEKDLERHRKTVNDIGMCVLCQMFMSFFVWGNLEDTRYPDVANSKTSMDNYTKSSVIIKNLNWFFEIQRNCLNMMVDLHQKQAWLKSI